MVVEEEAGDIQQIAKGRSVFTTRSLGSDDSKTALSRLLDQAVVTSSATNLAEMLNG